MKIRGSGMPDEALWESLFNVPLILSRLGIDQFYDVAELVCGYGTFTVPIAKAIRGTLYTFDVDSEMVTRTKARATNLNVICEIRDEVEAGCGVEADAVLLFNILHYEQPVELLQHAGNALRPAGLVLVIHWLHGETPRGPTRDVRPRPEQIVLWAAVAGLRPAGEVIDLSPWHFGLRLRMNRNT